MPTQVQFRRGTTAQNNAFTGAAGELSINSDNNSIRVHDGSTSGGYEVAKADLSNTSGIGSISIQNFSAQNLNITGLSTFVGVTTSLSGLFSKELNVSGVVTASSFIGNLTGNVTGNATGLSGTPNITINTLNASSGTISGNLNVLGVLTYEDVTNVDSIGIATARTGIKVLAGGIDIATGGLNVSDGISTFSGITTSTSGFFTKELNVSGIVTSNSYYIGATQVISNGRQLQNITSLDAITTATIESAVQASPNDFTSLNISGVSTFVGIVTTQDNIFVGNDLSVAGDARVIGILTVGSSSITFNGSENIINVGTAVTITTSTSTFKDLEIVGVTTFVGVATFKNDLYAQNLNVTSLSISGGGTLGVDIETRNISASGISTFTGLIIGNGGLNILGHTELDYVNISGISTISTLDTTTATIDYLSGTNVSYSGIGTIQTLDVATGIIDFLNNTNLNTSGLGTVGTLNVGVAGTIITTTIGGEVGINSITPVYKLDVGGVINSSTDVKIDGISVLTTASNDALALAIALG